MTCLKTDYVNIIFWYALYFVIVLLVILLLRHLLKRWLRKKVGKFTLIINLSTVSILLFIVLFYLNNLFPRVTYCDGAKSIVINNCTSHDQCSVESVKIDACGGGGRYDYSNGNYQAFNYNNYNNSKNNHIHHYTEGLPLCSAVGKYIVNDENYQKMCIIGSCMKVKVINF